ncbi:proton-conducting transporter membrane subunit [Acuticoccus sp. MNP-M23]|uniref:proton-conducting transporter transmembrane domain-containing protein n=1 Tax=Acuticoccus sp. MNP-M23 TaxID=3072793 RepID=UPI0028153ED1|nr:proton-conducting transporter membrane subunit [Acuticoccus sp. MNP-M23]WMS42033.1 proton-conducting transporter membrane subunit [Acuticoccus sp. MNP-M23]
MVPRFAFLLAGLFALSPSAALAASDAVDKADAMLTGATPLFAWLVVVPIVLPLLGAGVLLALRSKPQIQAGATLFILALTTLGAIGLNAAVAINGPIMMAMGNWLPPFGIVVTIDQLGALLVLVTSLVGLIGLGYARFDTDEDSVQFGFYSFYLLLITGVNGSFSTGDIFNLYVWFEVFLIASFGLLIMGGRRIQMDGAVKYGVLNLIATTIFLIAVAALYGVTGTLNMADIRTVLASADVAPPMAIGALFVLGFVMKAAAFPLHFWLPASYHTPRIVVAALFAGLLTKVGVYALLRIVVMLFGTAGSVFLPLIGVLGVLTAVLGALGALAQTDLRRMAAFLVVSGIGVALIGIGLGSEAGYAGAIVYMVHSIFAMTALFLVIGLCERLTGSLSLAMPGGIYTVNGLAAALFLIFGFAAAGLPPFSGFWPKLMLIQASLATGGTMAIAGAVGVILSGFLTTIVIGRAWALTFLKPAEGPERPAGDAAGLSAPLVLLAAIIIGLGIVPMLVIAPAEEGARGLIDPSSYIETVLGQEG